MIKQLIKKISNVWNQPTTEDEKHYHGNIDEFIKKLSNYKYIFVIGSPGSGKTILINYLKHKNHQLLNYKYIDAEKEKLLKHSKINFNLLKEKSIIESFAVDDVLNNIYNSSTEIKKDTKVIIIFNSLHTSILDDNIFLSLCWVSSLKFSEIINSNPNLGLDKTNDGRMIIYELRLSK